MKLRTVTIAGLAAMAVAAPGAYAAATSNAESSASATTLFHRWSLATSRELAGAGPANFAVFPQQR